METFTGAKAPKGKTRRREVRAIEFLVKIKTTKMIDGVNGVHYEAAGTAVENEKGDFDFEKISVTLSFGSKAKAARFPKDSWVNVEVKATQQRLDEEPVVEQPQQLLVVEEGTEEKDEDVEV